MLARKPRRRIPATAVLIGVALAGHGPAQAQPDTNVTAPPIISPKTIILYTHARQKYRAFVDPLICALQNIFRANVVAQSVDFPLTTDLRATASQFSPEKLGVPFMRATATDERPDTFKVLILPDDLDTKPFHYVFGLTFGNARTAYHFNITSTARLDPFKAPPAVRRTVLTRRLYKLLVKAVVRMAGYQGTGGCVLAFPRSLQQLDEKPADFCPKDRQALAAAGILRPKDEGGCLLLSGRSVEWRVARAEP